MNGAQAAHWNIPAEVTWGGQSGAVFNSLSEDFMKPVVNSGASQDELFFFELPKKY
jgi:hypothetical protein